ncbi:hypothetical protein GB928_027720 [Shinella curvata]|uniref:DUF6998 domain-containing protein n=1 Tax=Shinella curvata TaxID=1817964 RepID=A0ABT8XML4_9HYPH|nr:hypothetical protein [Shinella curvata]MCJ8057176.1 hypothetical protein [Shinella curvata]MDO6124977.1 hypothetical protein [Shinella curvata]
METAHIGDGMVRLAGVPGSAGTPAFAFSLPPVITDLVLARNRLRDHYRSAALEFTLDGNLIGDIGEAVAAELFGLKLSPRNGTGIDGHAPDGRSVQVKATGTNRGPAFRMVDTRADHLLFLVFDLENLKGEVVYNGPEEPVIKLLPTEWVGQKAVSLAQIRRADAAICDGLRLQSVL